MFFEAPSLWNRYLSLCRHERALQPQVLLTAVAACRSALELLSFAVPSSALLAITLFINSSELSHVDAQVQNLRTA